jgi:hypothetical protein
MDQQQVSSLLSNRVPELSFRSMSNRHSALTSVVIVPLPRRVARLNKRYTNRFIEPLASRLPGFVVVVHSGRHSGATYRTPVYAFTAGGHLLVALTYGPRSDWAQDMLIGGGIVERHGAQHIIRSSTVVDRRVAWPHVPLVVRAGLQILRVTEFLQIVVR